MQDNLFYNILKMDDEEVIDFIHNDPLIKEQPQLLYGDPFNLNHALYGSQDPSHCGTSPSDLINKVKQYCDIMERILTVDPSEGELRLAKEILNHSGGLSPIRLFSFDPSLSDMSSLATSEASLYTPIDITSFYVLTHEEEYPLFSRFLKEVGKWMIDDAFKDHCRRYNQTLDYHKGDITIERVDFDDSLIYTRKNPPVYFHISCDSHPDYYLDVSVYLYDSNNEIMTKSDSTLNNPYNDELIYHAKDRIQLDIIDHNRDNDLLASNEYIEFMTLGIRYLIHMIKDDKIEVNGDHYSDMDEEMNLSLRDHLNAEFWEQDYKYIDHYFNHNAKILYFHLDSIVDPIYQELYKTVLSRNGFREVGHLPFSEKTFTGGWSQNGKKDADSIGYTYIYTKYIIPKDIILKDNTTNKDIDSKETHLRSEKYLDILEWATHRDHVSLAELHDTWDISYTRAEKYLKRLISDGVLNKDHYNISLYKKIKTWALSHDTISISKIQLEWNLELPMAGRIYKHLVDDGVVDKEKMKNNVRHGATNGE